MSPESMGNCHRFVMEMRPNDLAGSGFCSIRILQSFDNSETNAGVPVGTF